MPAVNFRYFLFFFLASSSTIFPNLLLSISLTFYFAFFAHATSIRPRSKPQKMNNTTRQNAANIFFTSACHVATFCLTSTAAILQSQFFFYLLLLRLWPFLLHFFYILNMPNPPEVITTTKKSDKNFPVLSALFIPHHQQSSQSPQLLFQRTFLLLFFCIRICKTDAVLADTICRYVLSQNIQTRASALV